VVQRHQHATMVFNINQRGLITRQSNISTTEPKDGQTDHTTRNYTRVLTGLSIGLAISSSLAIYKIYATQKRRKTRVLFLEDWLLLFGVVSLRTMFVSLDEEIVILTRALIFRFSPSHL